MGQLAHGSACVPAMRLQPFGEPSPVALNRTIRVHGSRDGRGHGFFVVVLEPCEQFIEQAHEEAVKHDDMLATAPGESSIEQKIGTHLEGRHEHFGRLSDDGAVCDLAFQYGHQIMGCDMCPFAACDEASKRPFFRPVLHAADALLGVGSVTASSLALRCW